MSRGKQPRPLADRLRDLSTPEPNSGCILFLGYLDKDGYGQIRVGSRSDGTYANRRVHTVAYELFVGSVPEGKQLDHLCRVRCCINTDHLEPVTSRVNTLRGVSDSAINAKKTHCKNGHQLNGENLIKRHRGSRTERLCKECVRTAARERHRRINAVPPGKYRRQAVCHV